MLRIRNVLGALLILNAACVGLKLQAGGDGLLALNALSAGAFLYALVRDWDRL